jgi:aspartyl-tRNA(Asn)/glutamyl-tRNA(Gln) amidotransferase subunit B
MSDYQTYIGLEIHIHLLTATKMFCSCPAHYGDEPNSNVCPVCMGWPGVLPRLNERALELGYRVAKALNCDLSRKSLFARKNYFYPDMPKNYQISQFQDPIGKGGRVEFPLSSGGVKSIRLRECHLEEDAGKMIHAGDISLVDYNRAGYPLLEMVTEPDLATGEEAEDFIRYFQRLVRYLEVSDGNMEEGSLRCDANISIGPKGTGLGSKVEVKNLNSSRFVKLALNYEAKRQAEVLDSGGSIPQETRLWNENRDCTMVMRTKESSHDYRYFPEPDLPPFCPSAEFLEELERGKIDLPLVRRDRMTGDFGLTEQQADVLYDAKESADFFEASARAAAKLAPDALPGLKQAGPTVAAWMTGDLRKELNRRGVGLSGGPVSPDRLARLVAMQADGKINSKIAKLVLSEIFERDADPEAIVKQKGLELLNSPEAVRPFVAAVMSANAKIVADILAGDEKLVEFLIGKVMSESKGKADPAVARDLIGGELARAAQGGNQR